MLSLKNIMISLLLLLAIGLSSWSILLSHTHGSILRKYDPKEADSFMQDIIAVVLNKEGKPALKVSSPMIIHYPESDTTQITSPHVTVFRQSPSPWTIDSDYAKTTEGVDEILFWSKVNINHLADDNDPDTTVQTESLTVFPNQRLVKTDEAITFIQPNTKIHAVGMLADIEAGTIKLLSQTKGEYISTF